MDKTFEVQFSVYLDDSHRTGDSNLSDLKMEVKAFVPQQAQAMVEAMYNGRAKVWNVIQKS